MNNDEREIANFENNGLMANAPGQSFFPHPSLMYYKHAMPTGDVEQWYIQMCYDAAEAMEKRILEGKVIKDHIDSEGSRILVTLTSTGKYGYAVYKPGESKPHYLVEGDYLIEDLDKETAHNGVALRYPGAKSRIQRNMVGVFAEYIKDRGWEGFYLSVKMPVESDIQVAQHMAGYYPEDAVSFLYANFHKRSFSIPISTQVIMDPTVGDTTLRIATGGINPDGSIDFEPFYRIVQEAEKAKQLFGEKAMTPEQLDKVVLESHENTQRLFYGVYKILGLPMIPGITPTDLIGKAVNEFVYGDKPYTIDGRSEESLSNK